MIFISRRFTSRPSQVFWYASWTHVFRLRALISTAYLLIWVILVNLTRATDRNPYPLSRTPCYARCGLSWSGFSSKAGRQQV